MAIMYPKDIENYNYTDSEKYLYDRFREQLPDKYHVFYSVRWFDTKDGKRTDSESDFLVFDQNFGFITIEVKGGRGLTRTDNDWFITETVDGEENTRKLKCSPYEQAEKSMRHFYDYFRSEFNNSFHGAYGFAAAFPWYSCESFVSGSSPRELTIDCTDMDNLAHRINEIFHYWKNKRGQNSPFTAEQRKCFLSAVNKQISLSAAAGALIPIREKEFAAINSVQDNIIDALSGFNKLSFVGGAGTGKTFIGIKKAKAEYEAGKRVLFTCRSRMLADFVRLRLPEDPGRLVCTDFGSLMNKLIGKEYNENKTFDNIQSVVSKNPDIRFDCIIVDEAQDFDVNAGLAVSALLSDNFTYFYVFFDENQNLFSKNFRESFDIDYPPVILRYNIRNTGRIYENAVEKTGLGQDTKANALMGVEPEYSSYSNAGQCRKALNNIVNRLTRKEYVSAGSIVILSDTDFESSILKNETEIGSFTIDRNTESCSAPADSLRFRTVSDFKGLESDVVIFLNHISGENGDDHIHREQYVALTRARYYLYVLEINL